MKSVSLSPFTSQSHLSLLWLLQHNILLPSILLPPIICFNIRLLPLRKNLEIKVYHTCVYEALCAWRRLVFLCMRGTFGAVTCFQEWKFQGRCERWHLNKKSHLNRNTLSTDACSVLSADIQLRSQREKVSLLNIAEPHQHTQLRFSTGGLCGDLLQSLGWPW